MQVEFNRALLPRTLAALPDGGIRHGSIVQLSDSAQHFSVEIIVSHQEEWDEEKEPDGFALEGTLPLLSVVLCRCVCFLYRLHRILH